MVYECTLTKTTSEKTYGNGFGCDECGENGDGEMYHCEDHGYDECPKCYAQNQLKRDALLVTLTLTP